MIRAVSFDLDDTLWPIAPTIERAEQRLANWLQTRVPALARDCPRERLRASRDAVVARHPNLVHDYSAQRRQSLREILEDHPDCERLVEEAFALFYAARNEVDLYDDVQDCLQRLGRQLRLASLSNGNADLERIGLAHHFEYRVAARDVGAMKPDPAIFGYLCSRLGLSPGQVAHVGDDPELDVLGARRAGLFAIWLNRAGRPWPYAERPDLEVSNLYQLCAWFEAHPTVIAE